MKYIAYLILFAFIFLCSCTQTTASRPSKKETAPPFTKSPAESEDVIIPFDRCIPIRKTTTYTFNIKNRSIALCPSFKRISP